MTQCPEGLEQQVTFPLVAELLPQWISPTSLLAPKAVNLCAPMSLAWWPLPWIKSLSDFQSPGWLGTCWTSLSLLSHDINLGTVSPVYHVLPMLAFKPAISHSLKYHVYLIHLLWRQSFKGIERLSNLPRITQLANTWSSSLWVTAVPFEVFIDGASL